MQSTSFEVLVYRDVKIPVSPNRGMVFQSQFMSLKDQKRGLLYIIEKYRKKVDASGAFNTTYFTEWIQC